ncbi:MAG: hypothetical protein M3003_01805 [Candidatus Dormibacteraeota bacterium]|nr:hypothetical protein [Candidatus Dormibacteraeota bacterium]
MSQEARRFRRTVPALIATAVLWALVWMVAIGVRSNCPLGSEGQRIAGCQVTPVYTILHPGPEAFNHVFGALVFVVLTAMAIAGTIYLALRLRPR